MNEPYDLVSEFAAFVKCVNSDEVSRNFKTSKEKALYIGCMIKQYLFILFCFILFSTSDISAQSKKKGVFEKKKMVKQISPEDSFKRANELRFKDPKGAIAILEQIIKESREKERINEGSAYVLLGDIYLDINQRKLAYDRWNLALEIFKPYKSSPMKAKIYARLGQLALDDGNVKMAFSNFSQCLTVSTNAIDSLFCEEGLVDLALLKGNPKEGLELLDSIQSNYSMDSLSNARIEARRAQNFISQNNYSKASESFQNSVQILPKAKPITKLEYKPIEDAQNSLLNYDLLDNEGKRSISKLNLSSNAMIKQSSDLMVRENLKIASLYKDENNFSEATKFVERSKDVIDPNTSTENIANVFKTSYEINRKKGEMDLALADLEKYIEAKEEAANKLETDLSKQIDVVKGQQKIDIGSREYDIAQKDRALMQSQLTIQKIAIGLLSLLLLASLVFFFFLNKNVKEKRKANQLLYIKSLRTQMNPHFIFNALNSVNNFIAKNDEKAANKFLSDFSKLMRKVLDYSEKDFIDIEEELELNELYLKLEHFRFRDQFEYSFENNLNSKNNDIQIPPMLIQPFIENAVWHGLRYKEERGKLKVNINEKENSIIIEIEDDGIGREKSKRLKTANQKKYKSTGLENIAKRISLINDIYKKNYSIQVKDLTNTSDDTGTSVTIKIPIS